MGAINRGLLPGPFQSGDDQVVTDSPAQEATRCQEKTFVILAKKVVRIYFSSTIHCQRHDRPESWMALVNQQLHN